MDLIRDISEGYEYLYDEGEEQGAFPNAKEAFEESEQRVHKSEL